MQVLIDCRKGDSLSTGHICSSTTTLTTQHNLQHLTIN